jgi:hypothetical protein
LGKGGVLPMASHKIRCKQQLVANVLITDEAEFTRDSVVNFQNTHVWVDNNSHTTVASRHQHQFSINVCVGILDDHLLGSTVLTD